MRASHQIVVGFSVLSLVAGCSASIEGQAKPKPVAPALATTTPSSTPNKPLGIYVVDQIDSTGRELPRESPNPVTPAGDGKASCGGVAIGMAGALTGPDMALGLNILNGVKLAVQEHNAANPGCQVVLKQYDTAGDAQTASHVVPDAVNDLSVVGVIGPAFSGETQATGQMFADARLLQMTASATRPTLSGNGWSTFFRGLGSDAEQGPGLAMYATKILEASRVCVIGDTTPYGLGLGDAVRASLGAANVPSCQMQVHKGDTDFTAVVDAVSQASPDAVIYSGYYAEAAPLLAQLRAAGVKAKFLAGDGANDSQFIRLAGDAAAGAYLSCPCGQGPASFENAYAASSGQEPGVYSAEGYDLATIMLNGIDHGHVDRPSMLNFARQYHGQGLLRNYAWTSNGELVQPSMWIYQVK